MKDSEKNAHDRRAPIVCSQMKPIALDRAESTGMKRLLIVYHSITGGTEQMAHAVAEGAQQVPEVNTTLLHASQAGPEHLLQASGYVFATPETLATIAGLMKDFFDRSYYPVLGQLNARPYAALICAGSDGSNAARQLERIATGWRLKRIAPTHVVCTHAQSAEEILANKTIAVKELQHCRELGESFANGLAMGVF